MASAEYWAKRYEALEEAEVSKGAAFYNNAQKRMAASARNIEGQINSWYTRIANNNEVSIQDAHKLLSKEELKEFKWTVEEYVKKGIENSITGEWVKELENASAKAHIQRLEAIQAQIKAEAELMYGDVEKGLKSALSDVYEDTFYRTAYELQKGLEVGWRFNKLDEKKVDKSIMQGWTYNDQNFSDRLWARKEQLINNLNTKLVQGIVTGRAPQKVISDLVSTMGADRNNVSRLVLTETAHICEMAKKESFKDLGVEEYEIIATLDSRTSSVCQEMDKKHFKMSEYVEGETAPPFHPNCRTTTAPYIPDQEGFTRIARDENGNTYQVPANMSYKDWKAGNFKNPEDFKEYKILNPKEAPKADIGTFKNTISDLPRPVRKALSDVEVEMNSKYGSGFVKDTNKMYIAPNITKQEIRHEVGHAIEGKLFNPEKVRQLKVELTKGMTIDDIECRRATDSSGNVRSIYVLKSYDDFYSQYQTRIYAKTLRDCLDSNGNIDVDKMQEFVSVGCEYYFTMPNVARRYNKEIFHLIEESVKR